MIDKISRELKKISENRPSLIANLYHSDDTVALR